MSSDRSLRAVLYGVPGAGKSSVAMVLASMLGGQHIEMSDYARLLYAESSSETEGVTYDRFVNERLWRDGDFAIVARRAAQAWNGGPVIVSGPRRVEELRHLQQALNIKQTFEIRTAEPERLRRLGLNGVSDELARTRREREVSWGLVDRTIEGAEVLDNSQTLARSVWNACSHLADVPIRAKIDASEDLSELEFRFTTESTSVVLDRLEQASDVRRQELVDEWWIPSRVATSDEHERWLEGGLCAPVRLRMAGELASLTAKSPPNFRGVAEEFTIRFASSEVATFRRLLIRLGLKSVATITKVRRQATLPDRAATISVDVYEHLTMVEVELDQSEGRVSDRYDQSDALATLLALVPDAKFESIGPVPLAIVRMRLQGPERGLQF